MSLYLTPIDSEEQVVSRSESVAPGAGDCTVYAVSRLPGPFGWSKRPSPICCDETMQRTIGDRVHLLDMIDVGLLDDSWLPRLPAELAPRLRELLENHEG
jgi:hypothetical protein